MLQLVWPAEEFLAGYVDALGRGWSPDNVRGEAAAKEILQQIASDRALFIQRQVDRDARGEAITLPDGSQVPRLPSYNRWLWDGEFCGVIGFRWQSGTNDLPPHCLGHVGFAVVPWKQRRGYATTALRMFLPEAKAEGLGYVELITDIWNFASQRVIEANGGIPDERFVKPPQYGGGEALLYRIALE